MDLELKKDHKLGKASAKTICYHNRSSKNFSKDINFLSQNVQISQKNIERIQKVKMEYARSEIPSKSY
jgi:hypothetical protein